MADKHTSNRGFARMSAEKQREIASKGGRAAHEKGTAHEFTSEEARTAGRKGGERSHANRSALRQDQPEMNGQMGNRGEEGQMQPESGQPNQENKSMADRPE